MLLRKEEQPELSQLGSLCPWVAEPALPKQGHSDKTAANTLGAEIPTA